MDRLHRVYARSFMVGLALAVGVAALAAFGWEEASQRAKERTRIRYALCVEIETVKAAQLADVTRRIAASQRFLRDHPRGIPGIPPALILRGIRDSKETAAGLHPRDCHAFSKGDLN